MSAPRLEIDLHRIAHNARAISTLYGSRGVSVTAVTKAVLGAPAVAKVLVGAGITSIGDSRIENIRSMREAGIEAEFTLIRSPMPSEARSVVEHADISLNTELSVIAQLSKHAATRGKRHKIILMVELGDMREGIMPSELGATIAGTLDLKGVELIGIGTNLACFGGAKPTDGNMGQLAHIAERMRNEYAIALRVISGGNSASYEWFVSTRDWGLINNVRVGESIFLGRETLRREKIAGLYTDAFTLVAEVIELKTKPTASVGERGQDAFGHVPVFEDRGVIRKAILGIGKQDVDVDGIDPQLDVDVLGATSDHLVLDAKDADIQVGSEVAFNVNYSALLRAMTSPYVTKEYGCFSHHRSPRAPRHISTSEAGVGGATCRHESSGKGGARTR